MPPRSTKKARVVASRPAKNAQAKQSAKKAVKVHKMSRSQAAEATASLDAQFKAIHPTINAGGRPKVASPVVPEQSIHELAKIMGGL
ncbi:hypothetical protein EVG20_g2114 [Dentipellis fragilis]|uniref:Uncharacterized protein n=1 Tax=Dentipellis fragilis TaxID=205917 RepID=A0A4Y9Z7P2_9AGAM|nr:hypothetical protein EVG20_g2114 [Dentipellis fragilis]